MDNGNETTLGAGRDTRRLFESPAERSAQGVAHQRLRDGLRRPHRAHVGGVTVILKTSTGVDGCAQVHRFDAPPVAHELASDTGFTSASFLSKSSSSAKENPYAAAHASRRALLSGRRRVPAARRGPRSSPHSRRASPMTLAIGEKAPGASATYGCSTKRGSVSVSGRRHEYPQIAIDDCGFVAATDDREGHALAAPRSARSPAERDGRARRDVRESPRRGAPSRRYSAATCSSIRPPLREYLRLGHEPICRDRTRAERSPATPRRTRRRTAARMTEQAKRKPERAQPRALRALPAPRGHAAEPRT